MALRLTSNCSHQSSPFRIFTFHKWYSETVLFVLSSHLLTVLLAGRCGVTLRIILFQLSKGKNVNNFEVSHLLRCCAMSTSKYLISNFRRVLNVVCFLLGDSPSSEIYMPTFRNTLFHLHRQPGAFYMHLPAYEDGTDRVFRNVGI